VFNHDKSHFAVIWTQAGGGGFTKFDVAFMKVVQRFPKTVELRKEPKEIRSLALIHKTDAFIICMEEFPNEVKFYRSQDQLSRTLFFAESVAGISVLSGALYTLIALQTKIYIYKESGKSLVDIVTCYKP
jgi:hypothetical protein